LLSIGVDCDVSSIVDALRRLGDEIDQREDAVFKTGADRVAQTAIAIHPWQNRTGDLEASIEALPPIGSVMEGTLQGGVAMGEPYGVYLEANPQWAVLGAAYELIEPFLERDLQAALDAAVSAVGLR
jgi:hypothetical protein